MICVSFSYMALRAAEPWAKRWYLYSDKETYQNWTSRSTEVLISKHAWKIQWEAYFSPLGLDDQAGEKQVQALRYLHPTINQHITDRNSACTDHPGRNLTPAIMQILPDSGADISVAGPHIIWSLRDHPNNFLPSQITSRTINGQKMTPTGKFSVQIKIGNHTHKDELHIYPNV